MCHRWDYNYVWVVSLLKRKKTYCLLIIASLVVMLSAASLLSMPTAEAEENDDKMILLRGYFAPIEVPGDENKLELELSHPEGPQYNFSYHDGSWTGNTTHLLENKSSYQSEEGLWSVMIAVEDRDPLGDDWVLETGGDDMPVRVEDMSEGDISITGSPKFWFDPHSSANKSCQRLTVTNDASVEQNIVVEYDENHTDSLTWAGDSSIEANSEKDLTFYYEYDAGAPEDFTFRISVFLEYPYRFDEGSDGNVRVGSIGQATPSAEILVGREGFEDEAEAEYIIEYEDNIYVDGNTEANATFYIHPKEEFYLEEDDIEGENVDIKEIHHDFDEVLSPEDLEVPVNVTFESHYEEDGSIALTVLGNTYRTGITIEEPAQPPTEDPSFIEDDTFIVGTAFAVLILGILGVRYWKEERS